MSRFTATMRTSDFRFLYPDLQTKPSFEILEVSLIFIWLTVTELCLLDIAVSNHSFRSLWLDMLKSLPF
jgi:hypothetical protein